MQQINLRTLGLDANIVILLDPTYPSYCWRSKKHPENKGWLGIWIFKHLQWNSWNYCAELRSFRRGWIALRWHKINTWQQIRTMERCCLALYPGSFCSVLFFFLLSFLLFSCLLSACFFSVVLPCSRSGKREKDEDLIFCNFGNPRKLTNILSESSKIEFPCR